MKFYIDSKREAWIDNVKLFAIICVVLGHSVCLLVYGHVQPVSGYIASYNMPLFMFMSGLMVEKSLRKVDSIQHLIYYLLKLYKRLLLPSACLSAIVPLYKGELFDRKLWIVFFAVNICLYIYEYFYKKDDRIKSAISLLFVVGCYYSSIQLNFFWFMTSLSKLQITFTLVSFVLALFLKNKENIKCLCSCAAVYLLIYIHHDSWTTELCSYYLLAIIFVRFNVLEKIFSMNLIWYATAVLVVSYLWSYSRPYLFYICSIYDMIVDGEVLYFFLRQFVAIVLSLSFVKFIHDYSSRYNVCSLWGSKSMEIYLIHVLLLNFITFPKNIEWDSEFQMWMTIGGFFILLILFSVVVITILEKNKITRQVFLGREL